MYPVALLLALLIMILIPLQKLPKIVVDLSKIIVAKGFEKLPKVQ